MGFSFTHGNDLARPWTCEEEWYTPRKRLVMGILVLAVLGTFRWQQQLSNAFLFASVFLK